MLKQTVFKLLLLFGAVNLITNPLKAQVYVDNQTNALGSTAYTIEFFVEWINTSTCTPGVITPNTTPPPMCPNVSGYVLGPGQSLTINPPGGSGNMEPYRFWVVCSNICPSSPGMVNIMSSNHIAGKPDWGYIPVKNNCNTLNHFGTNIIGDCCNIQVPLAKVDWFSPSASSPMPLTIHFQ